ncbi:MAG: hydantoinase/oxoprolinase N-terminal domain-containing protein, partial [Burkholderiaceae bacterium]
MSEVKQSGRHRVRVASDIGGTFTDVVLQIGRQLITTKVLTTPQAPEEAVIAGVCQVLEEAALRFSDIDVFLHGTTL